VTGRKPLIFTRHALGAIAERALAAEWIDAAVFEPEWEESEPDRSAVVRRFRSIPEHNSRILRVACVETDEHIRVLTAFFDRRARRPQ